MIVEVDDLDLGEWVEFNAQRRASSPDSVTVAFTKKKIGHTATIRIGTEVMKKMRWTEKDKISLFLSKKDKYKWGLAVSSKGYKLIKEDNNNSARKIQLSWNNDDVTYTKAKECRYEIDKGYLVVHVPN